MFRYIAVSLNLKRRKRDIQTKKDRAVPDPAWIIKGYELTLLFFLHQAELRTQKELGNWRNSWHKIYHNQFYALLL
jgi:hypothetical protein